MSYDLSGKGRTALKAYYGRFYNQFGSEIAETINPNARINVTVPWNDLNSNLRLDQGELATRPTAGTQLTPDPTNGDLTVNADDKTSVYEARFAASGPTM